METVIYFILFFLSIPLHYLFYKKDFLHITDIPNDRSMHEIPTKKSAGLVFNTLFILGISLAYYWKDLDIRIFFCFASGVIFLEILGFLDDKFNLSSILRLILEFVFLFVLFLIVNFQPKIFSIYTTDQFLNALIFSIFTLFVVNLTNFMDGLDLYLAGVFLTFPINLSLVYGLQNENLYIVLFTFLVVFLPYYYFNFPTAKLFMGDSGSLPIGFIFAVSPFFASNYGFANLEFSILLLPIFWIDGLFTLIQRTVAKKNILKAHKEHLYQKVQGVLFTKKQTILIFIMLNLLGGLPYYLLHKTMLAFWITIAINLIFYFTIYFLYYKKSTATSSS